MARFMLFFESINDIHCFKMPLHDQDWPMRTPNMKKHIYLMSVLAIFGTAACGTDTDDNTKAQGTADGVDKLANANEKADAFNRANDPARFRKSLNYKFEELPTSGEITNTPWTASYWPMYEDGINARWQGKNTLSPAEKYDKVFNEWTPGEGFMNLKPFDTSTCEWDDEYYNQLGPAAKWADRNKGNWRAHNGIDDDGDGVADKDECDNNDDAVGQDFDGIETWFGLCHAWAPAALLEPEPLAPVTRDGVTFDVSDLKALTISLYDRTAAYGIGERCNVDDKKWEFDEDGKILDRGCADMNPGALHVIVTNFVGINKQGFVVERTPDYEIWNQPVRGYEITEQQEITQQEAYTLLDIDDPADDLSTGNGVLVQGVEEESEYAKYILKIVNESSQTTLDDDVRLYSNEARHIAEYRQGADGQLGTSDDVTIKTLKELDDIKYVGKRAFGRLLGYALANGYGKKAYKYNPEAERFIKVRLDLHWITEQLPMAERTDTIIDRYTRTDTYDYILELDAEGNILGGEYFGDSKKNHADFIWLPTRTYGGNPHLSLSKVRDMVKESRRIALGDQAPETKTATFTSSEILSIPDASSEGVRSDLEVDAKGTVEKVVVNVDITHTYRGDIILVLQHGASQHIIFDGRELPSNERYLDDIQLQDLEVEGFNNSEAAGTWTLWAYDIVRQDVGQITGWNMTLSTVE